MQDQDTSWLQILSNIVHDLKAPLSSTKTLIDGIAEVGELNERQQYFADRARMKLMQMTGMINTILDLAWMDADHPLNLAPVDLSIVIRHNLSLLEESAAQNKVELRTEVASNLGLIEADERMMHQIMGNLLSNAVKYNCEGGYVQVTATGDHERVRVMVEDCGKGIPPHDQPHVFERFYRAKASSKQEGTGLGLAIVKAAVERHHGEVGFVSEADKGTTFTVVLPRRQRLHTAEDSRERGTGEMRRAHEGEDDDGWLNDIDKGDESLDAVDDSIQESQEGADDAIDARAEAGRRSHGTGG